MKTSEEIKEGLEKKYRSLVRIKFIGAAGGSFYLNKACVRIEDLEAIKEITGTDNVYVTFMPTRVAREGVVIGFENDKKF